MDLVKWRFLEAPCKSEFLHHSEPRQWTHCTSDANTLQKFFYSNSWIIQNHLDVSLKKNCCHAYVNLIQVFVSLLKMLKMLN